MKNKKGFTLIELVMVIVILGILAASVVPRFLDLTTQAKIAATKGSLGGIRAAILVDYADNAASGNASFPASITTSMFADAKIPAESVSGAQGTAVAVGTYAPSADTGGWLYNSAAGTVVINTNVSNYSTY